jgi:2,3-bisphosphoglycerate-dependent phosphoglycerate mutase
MAAEYRQPRFARPPGATDLILVRHGESAPHRPGASFALVDGHGDPELSPDGHDQAERVGARLASEPVDAIYVSSLRRTHETAAPLAARIGITPAVEPDLREVHLGEWEGGLFRKKVAEGDPIAEQMYLEQRWDVIPGAESSEDFAGRIRRALDGIARTHPDQTVAVFTHGGVIGQVMAEASGARGFAFTGSDNCGITHVVIANDRWIVRTWNDTSHLSPRFTHDPEPLI